MYYPLGPSGGECMEVRAFPKFYKIINVAREKRKLWATFMIHLHGNEHFLKVRYVNAKYTVLSFQHVRATCYVTTP